MNQKNLVKYIRQVENQIMALREANMDETLRDERIKENVILRKYYTRQLTQLKWNWLLWGNDIETIIN